MRCKILYIQYTNPAGYPPLDHSSRIFAREGWHVLFLGTGALGADALCFPPHERIEVRRMPFCPGGWRQKLHYLRFCLWVLGWTLRWRPRWVYASDPLSCPIALSLSYLPGLRVIYHEHDSPKSEVRGRRLEVKVQRSEIRGQGPAGSRFMRSVLWTRRQVTKRALLCVLPNERRAERFGEKPGRPIVNGHQSTAVVWNCPSVDEISEPRAPHDG